MTIKMKYFLNILFSLLLLCLSTSNSQAQAVPNQIRDLLAPMLGQHAFLDEVYLWYVDTKANSDQDVLVLLQANSGTSELWTPQITAFSQAGYRVGDLPH